MDNGRKTNQEPYVRIADDEMAAYLTLPPLNAGESYDPEDLLYLVAYSGLAYGVNKEFVRKMAKENMTGREYQIAKGVPVIDGVDGYFEYKFNTELNNRPTVHPDGTVDYWSIHAVEIVEEGQLLAIYHEPVAGQNGVTVRGKYLTAKKGRPQPPLVGRGFERSADGKTYTASMEGKIEKRDNRLQISTVYEVTGDVDMHTGNIEFRGDVIVHGNVVSGFSIKATGSVTVDGTSEACYIEAGKDIILRGGLLGGGKGVLKSKGNIFARFIEYATVEAEGFLDATSAMNSKITCYDKVYMSGRNANIIGGEVYGTGGLEVANVGNTSEVATTVAVGMTKELIAEMARLENQLSTDNEVVRKINEGIEQFDEAARAANLNLRNDERRVALLRTRIMKQAEIAKEKEALTRLQDIMERAKNAKVRVFGIAYCNVRVNVNTSSTKVIEMCREVEFVQRRGKVVPEAIPDS